MGVVFSCPLAQCSDVTHDLESIIAKSIGFRDDQVKTPLPSISFKKQDSEPTIIKSQGSGRMTLEGIGSITFKTRELETLLSVTSPSSNKAAESLTSIQQLPLLDPGNPRYQFATKLQKVYKSFRTSRKIADCAVLVEQNWWKLLDFAQLKRSSISFFDLEKHETAISRWSRARTRAAKVGKGLSKSDTAQKLALQHWLEAIDPRHRYGHNLHFYYVKWLQSQSQQPFFYWLDIGEGKEVKLVGRCPRSKLQQQCIKYLGPSERKPYEVVIADGKFFYKQTEELLHTTESDKWIFVLSTSKTLYVGKKKKGKFQHSSFLAGGATIAAGRIVVENSTLKAVWPHSGHYRPTEENFKEFVSFLMENSVDLTDVKMTPVDEEVSSIGEQKRGKDLRCNSSEEDLTRTLNGLETEDMYADESTWVEEDCKEQENGPAVKRPKSKKYHNLSRKLTDLEIPKHDELLECLEKEQLAVASHGDDNNSIDSLAEDGYETDASTKNSEDPKPQMSDKDHGDYELENIPEELILRQINSKKELKSYQLAKQLSCKLASHWVCEGLSFRTPVPGFGASELVS